MKRLLFTALLFSAFCCNKSETNEQNFLKTLNKIKLQKNQIYKNKIKADTTLLGFEFGEDEIFFIARAHELNEKGVIKSNISSFYWNVKIDNITDLNCFVKPVFYNNALISLYCKCENTLGLAGITSISKFSEMLNSKYGRNDFSYKDPFTQSYEKIWLKDGQEIKLFNEDKYLKLNYHSIFLNLQKDSLENRKDSLNLLKNKSFL